MHHHAVSLSAGGARRRVRAAVSRPRLVVEREVVADVMSWPATFVSSDTAVREALDIAEENGQSHLLVVDEEDLLGVACTCDLWDAGPTDPVSRWMSTPPLTVDSHVTLARAAELMERGRVGCLAVTGHHLHGIVTRGDLERAGALLDRPRCTSCGSKHHVRQVGSDWLGFCMECLRRPPREIRHLYEDFGGD
jgi:CBS domain-containing protein